MTSLLWACMCCRKTRTEFKTCHSFDMICTCSRLTFIIQCFAAQIYTTILRSVWISRVCINISKRLLIQIYYYANAQVIKKKNIAFALRLEILMDIDKIKYDIQNTRKILAKVDRRSPWRGKEEGKGKGGGGGGVPQKPEIQTETYLRAELFIARRLLASHFPPDVTGVPMELTREVCGPREACPIAASVTVRKHIGTVFVSLFFTGFLLRWWYLSCFIQEITLIGWSPCS